MKIQGPHLLPEAVDVAELAEEAIGLLRKLIAIPSFSREEDRTADLIQQFLEGKGIKTGRKLNNVWAYNDHYDASKPTLLLNSHHDTVKADAGYTMDPFEPVEMDGKLFGLGSNDAGGALVSLLAVFLHYHKRTDLRFNLLFAATAEEEISGRNGVELVLPELGQIAFGIVGEPTQMQMAIAEKGLLVLDCIAYGRPGHAAREEGENAIYKALNDIEWFRTFRFPAVSELLGEVKMTVTLIRAGSQHNVVPGMCEFTVDVRTTDVYTNEEVLRIVRESVNCEVRPRSLRLCASAISREHPLVKAGMRLGSKVYGSPTMSDQALMRFPTLKMGPGNSARSHTANEFIFLDEIKEGISLYMQMLDQVISNDNSE
jgi:acetylornithine deacetylase